MYEVSGYLQGSLDTETLQASGQLQPRVAGSQVGDWAWTGALTQGTLTGSAAGTSSVDLDDTTVVLSYTFDFSVEP